MSNITINTTPYEPNVSTTYLNYAGFAVNDGVTLNNIRFQPVSWESLSNAAATTTYTPYELVSYLQPNGEGWQAFGDASTINIEGVSDAVIGNPRTLNRLTRNQRAQLEMTTDNLSEYLFDILDGRYGMNDVKSVEPNAVPIPKEKLLEVLLVE